MTRPNFDQDGLQKYFGMYFGNFADPVHTYQKPVEFC